MHDLTGAQIEALQLVFHRGQRCGFKGGLDRTFADLGVIVGTAANGRRMRVIAGKRRARDRRLRAQARDLVRYRIDAEQALGGALLSLKENALRAPLEQPRILIEIRGNHHGLAPRGNHRKTRVLIVVELLAIGGFKCDHCAIGRPHGVGVGAFGLHDLHRRMIGEAQRENVTGSGRTQVRIAGRAKRNAFGIRRPIEAADAKERTFGEGFGLHFLAVNRNWSHPQMDHRIILLDDLNVAVFFLALLVVLAFRIARGVGDHLRIGRPVERVDAGFGMRQLDRFPALRENQIDLLFATVAVRQERKALAVTRPFRRGAGFCRRGQWVDRFVPSPKNPDLGSKFVFLPVGFRDQVGNHGTVRRDARPGNGLPTKGLFGSRRVSGEYPSAGHGHAQQEEAVREVHRYIVSQRGMYSKTNARRQPGTSD